MLGKCKVSLRIRRGAKDTQRKGYAKEGLPSGKGNPLGMAKYPLRNLRSFAYPPRNPHPAKSNLPFPKCSYRDLRITTTFDQKKS